LLRGRAVSGRSQEGCRSLFQSGRVLPDRGMSMDRFCNRGNLWSIVLAGGEGERLRPLLQQWLGHHRPKQYCTFVGTRSMLQHTLDRLAPLSGPENRITVVMRSHLAEASTQLVESQAGT